MRAIVHSFCLLVIVCISPAGAAEIGLGEHCPSGLFRSARDEGVSLEFEPEGVESIAICGPGNHDGGGLKAAVRDYLVERQTPCFDVLENDDAMSVRANTSSGLVARRVIDDVEVFFCRCHPVQVDLILERGDVCGFKIPA